ncbi:activating transcription factor 7-interacting protein 2 isoform X2 [Sphaeramia orbicularis]|uniref:activating transcription factor 7-interacting protein 2 isoform X2 n=1 Tax=Sphaeramia orbicularis TaxID=375764 RepID=UPI00117CDF25|nr:activating transcription factor 7-interacting protein 2 isoform X2 [Sphaeramia orbicularis]
MSTSEGQLTMKRYRPASPAASYENITISQSKMQKLIQQEVNNALKKKETRLDTLLATIQELDCRIDFESSLQKLEAQVKKVTKRSEAVLAHLTKTQKKDPLEFCNVAEINSINPEEEAMETVSYNDTNTASCTDFMEKSKELSAIMETTTTVLLNMRADNTALNAAIADLTADPPPPVLTPCEQVIAIRVKTEPEDDTEFGNTPEEPLKVPKVEPFCPDYEEEAELSHPPLPPLLFPLTLSPEAASYNVPQRLTVKLALIKRPACLSVLWSVDEDDPLAPPMDSYSVYMSTEKVKGSNIFPYWKLLETVKAVPLPMFKMVTDYQPGHKVCVVVVGKDIFDRYGPYSHVVIATIPEDG